VPLVPHRRVRLVALVVGTALLVVGCGKDDGAPVVDEKAPALGACRVLSPDEVAEPDNASATVDCTEAHTAETFAVGDLPHSFDDADYDDKDLGAWAYEACSKNFIEFLGGDESLVMRTVVSWAWFRPSVAAWDKGARWYRCDVVGGGEQSKDYVDLPMTAKGLLLGKPKDRWMVCADGETVAGSVKVPCTEPHGWRAVTTIALGEQDDVYPGDRLVEVTTRDFCSKSVGAWLNYPVDYDFGYTWFHQAEWDAGNRRSVCWAKMDR
jgi:Septum formation